MPVTYADPAMRAMGSRYPAESITQASVSNPGDPFAQPADAVVRPGPPSGATVRPSPVIPSEIAQIAMSQIDLEPSRLLWRRGPGLPTASHTTLAPLLRAFLGL